MFNQRQLEILLELFEHPDTYITASVFAKKQGVSLRTVQNDIKKIKDTLTNITCITFQSLPPKGSRVVIHNQAEFDILKESLYIEFTKASTNCHDNRINELIYLLLYQHRSISLYDLEDIIHVSCSTLLNDLKRVNEIVSLFNLEVLRNSNKIIIDGSEINKRRCIMETNLATSNISLNSAFSSSQSNDMTRIKDILVEVFVLFKRHISESELMNTLTMLYVALRRMQSSFFILPYELEISESLYPEREIASAVYNRIAEHFHIRVTEDEIDYFALYMKGQRENTSSDISSEVDDCILDILVAIRDNYGVNLTDNLNLRMALAMHCASLFVRIKYDMQLKNRLVDYIRQSYPQGFDMATFFASKLQEMFGKHISDDEISFIAVHLYCALYEHQQKCGDIRKMLIISSLRWSENILLQQTLSKWFSDQVTDLVFVTPSEVEDSMLDEYDVIATTEKGKYYDKGIAFYINQFPNKQDYLNLKLAMDGFRSLDDIIDILHRDLYFTFEHTDKDTILKTLCNNAAKTFQLDGLYSAVTSREDMRSTFFGNSIAAPHPLNAISSDTFVSIGVSIQPVEWDANKNMVNLVLLVVIGKNSHKAFQLWNYLSKLFTDKKFVELLIANPSYGNFIKLLKNTLIDDID